MSNNFTMNPGQIMIYNNELNDEDRQRNRPEFSGKMAIPRDAKEGEVFEFAAWIAKDESGKHKRTVHNNRYMTGQVSEEKQAVNSSNKEDDDIFGEDSGGGGVAKPSDKSSGDLSKDDLDDEIPF